MKTKINFNTEGISIFEDDLKEAFEKISSTASNLGISFDDVSSIINFIWYKTGKSGGAIGNALKTIFTRLQKNEVKDFLNQIGVETKERSVLLTLTDLANRFSSLEEKQKNDILESVGGIYQVNILRSLLFGLKNNA